MLPSCFFYMPRQHTAWPALCSASEATRNRKPCIRCIDAAGQKLNGANRYTVRFAPGQLPPVHAFWSLTMYELPKSLLVANPINRYLINSPMLPQLKRNADGGLTLIIQNESPGKDKEPNWLPAPKGPFSMIMRLYWPKEEAIDGKWTAPPLKRAE